MVIDNVVMLNWFNLVRYYHKAIAMVNDDALVLEGKMSSVLSLMKKTFYSNNEIFLRELINNAFDVSSLSSLILYLYISYTELLSINVCLHML